MRCRLLLIMVLGAVTVCAGCRFGETKPAMAVMSVRDALIKCNAGIKAAEEVREKFASRQEALKQQEEAIGKLQSDPGLTDPKTGKRVELEVKTRQYIMDSQALQKDVGEEESLKYKPIIDKLNKALAAYAKERGLISVQDKNGFAYVDPSIDITEAIIQKVDAMQ